MPSKSVGSGCVRPAIGLVLIGIAFLLVGQSWISQSTMPTAIGAVVLGPIGLSLMGLSRLAKFALVMGLGWTGVTWLILNDLVTSSPGPSHPPLASRVLVQCQNAVKERLKSPGSAKFKGMFDDPLEDVVMVGPGKYEVVSWVEAQNAFGATIRSTYVCSVDDGGGTTEVRIVE